MLGADPFLFCQMILPVKKLLKALTGVLYQKLAGNKILKALSGYPYQN